MSHTKILPIQIIKWTEIFALLSNQDFQIRIRELEVYGYFEGIDGKGSGKPASQVTQSDPVITPVPENSKKKKGKKTKDNGSSSPNRYSQ
jgi:hypothetical protein